jgi:hypothetical protein
VSLNAVVTLVEFDGVAGGIFSTIAYKSGSVQADTRIIGSLTVSRSVGWPFNGERPRGAAGLGELTFANADGKLTAVLTPSLRDTKITVKRGTQGTAYASLVVVAVALVDEVRHNPDLTITVVTRSLAGRLERAVQTALYSDTVPNQALRSRPRPVVLGTCYQVPLLQPSPYGNGAFDVHDNEQFFGIDMLMDRGVPLAYNVSYTNARTSGIYGVERSDAVQGQQLAIVEGQLEVLSTLIDEPFNNLNNWNEFNGNVAGRDASIVNNALSLVNTAGGADLTLQYVNNQTSNFNEWWWWEFDCTSWTSGSCTMRLGALAAVAEVTVNRAGRYWGVAQAPTIRPVFVAANGSNCSLTIDNLRVLKVRPNRSFAWLVQQLVSVRGPLSWNNDVDTASADLIDTTHARHYGLYVGDQLQIADALDMLCNSAPAVWYTAANGKLTFAPIRTPAAEIAARGTAFAFNESHITSEVQVTPDRATALSDVALGKRNWATYRAEDLAGSLQYVANSTTDKGGNITISGDNYRWTANGAGGVRATFPLHGGRWYVEQLAVTVDGGQNSRIGLGNTTASVTAAPGQDTNALAYGANGQTWVNGTGTAYGATWAANDRIGMALDTRGGARGQAYAKARVRFSKNGTWQSTDDPNDETSTFREPQAGINGIGFVLTGAGATGNSGVVNFGQVAPTYAVPADYIMPAWHYQLCQLTYRDSVTSTVTLSAAYAHADAAAGRNFTPRDESAESAPRGWPTLLVRRADLQDFIDDVCGLYTVPRAFYEFEAFIDETSADTLQPLRGITLTFAPLSLTAKQLVVVGVTVDSLTGRCEIRAWG